MRLDFFDKQACKFYFQVDGIEAVSCSLQYFVHYSALYIIDIFNTIYSDYTIVVEVLMTKH